MCARSGRADEATVAHNLFAVLRQFDADGVDIIYSEAFPDDGIGLAVMNRMNKAAGHHHLRIARDGTETETGGNR